MSAQNAPHAAPPHNPLKAGLIALACVISFASVAAILYAAPFFFRTQTNYNRLVQYIIANNKTVADFNRIFPGSSHFISHYIWGQTPSTWSSSTTLYGKYELTLQFQVSIDFTGQTGTQISPPSFYIYEAQSVSGRTITYTGRDFNLTTANWPDLVKHNGDFSAIGLPLIKDAPVPGFSEISH